MANTWGESGTTWGLNAWGQQSDTSLALTGFETTASLGAAGWGRSTWGNDAWGEESIVNIEIGHPVTGFAITASLGTPQINYDFIFTLSESLLGTLSLGTPTVTDMAIGVSGLEISGSLGSGGVSPLHYKDVDITGNTSYTNTTVTGNTSYTDIEHSA